MSVQEALMVELGQERARKILERHQSKGVISATKAGVALQKRLLDAYITRTREWIKEALAGKATTWPKAAVLLKDYDVERVCYIACRHILDTAHQRRPLWAAARRVSNFLEYEFIPDMIEKKSPHEYAQAKKRLRQRSTSEDRAAEAIMLFGMDNVGTPRTLWDNSEKLHIGSKLIDLFIETTGAVEVFYTFSRRHRQTRICLSPKIEEWLKNYNELALTSQPYYLPLLEKPKPWTDIQGGAYWSSEIRPLDIVTKPSKARLKLLKEADLSLVYNGLNAMQETPWRINQRVLDVQEELWERDAGISCLPHREDVPPPPKPDGFEEAEPGSDLRKQWRAAARRVHEANARERSNRFSFARTMALAKQHAEYPALYFPHRCDFRGRVYSVGTGLNPQGADHVRALLEFADGKPVDERAIWWLGVHGANLSGNDKISLEERYRWALAYTETARLVSEDPIRNLAWTEADKPWQFLAWCFEWAAIHDPNRKEPFVSHIPIHLDGSCNGIQHFSAMLRDEVGGKAVNLIPSEVPQDIYQAVADRTIEILAEATIEDNPETFWMAQSWLAFGIDRKMTKRSVMTLPYGATFHSCMAYTDDAFQERLDKGVKSPFGSERRKAISYLAQVIWQAIGDVVIAAREAMAWLQECARIAAKHNVPIVWTAPSGFPVLQHYKNVKHRRVKTQFQGGLVYLACYEELDTIDKSKQALALSPNFVHSLDAAALMYTIRTGQLNGISSFAMIHDSFATTAADTDELSRAIRASFVVFYDTFDVLGKFREEVQAQLPEGVELPPVPNKGTLDITQVMHSDYFFA